MLRVEGAPRALYSAVFHAVSAFCNAGFSLYSDSLVGWRHNALVMAAVMLLIVFGGIGHPVVVDLWRNLPTARSRRHGGRGRLELGSLVALVTSGLLVVSGAVLLLVFGLTSGEARWGIRVVNALFQSVTARTAGFNTVSIGSLPVASLLLIVLLMFIGGSPGSCAGGIKTTTFALWLGKLRSLLRGGISPRLWGRNISSDIAGRASVIIGLAVLWNLVGVLLLSATEGGAPGRGLHDVLFEQISAFGTVGLSTGLTTGLSSVGKLWIIATMFVGRLGPLTLGFLAFNPGTRGVRYPEGRVMVG
jgi:trk system potassium uptake protein TrkH